MPAYQRPQESQVSSASVSLSAMARCRRGKQTRKSQRFLQMRTQGLEADQPRKAPRLMCLPVRQLSLHSQPLKEQKSGVRVAAGRPPPSPSGAQGMHRGHTGAPGAHSARGSRWGPAPTAPPGVPHAWLSHRDPATHAARPSGLITNDEQEPCQSVTRHWARLPGSS